jgi:predicted Zn-dependent peptidase
MASMLTEGTESHSSRSLAEEIERLGASLGASSGSDNTRLSASCLSPYVSDVLRLMREILLKPTFPQSELDLYKQNTIEGLKFQRSQASFLATEQVARIIYGQHPYATVSPAAEDIEKIDRDALVEQQRRTLIPNNAVLVVVGDVERDAFLAEFEAGFAEWEPGEKPTNEFPEVAARTGRTLTIVDRKGSAQANIVLALPGINRNHPDFFPVLVMNQILGSGASSRIFMNLREEKGYTYGAYSKFDMKRLGGEFEATAEVRTAVTGDSIREFFFELNRIRDERVSDDELRDAINYLTGVFPIRAETQEGLTNLIVQQKIYGLPDDYLQTYRERVAEVTADEVERVARAYVRPDEVAIVIVGDAESILPQAREYAPTVEIFDTEGNPVPLENFGRPAAEPAVDLTGKWTLKVDFQGQGISVDLVLNQDGAAISGKLESMLGEGKIDGGNVTGNSFSAVAVTEMQGRAIEIAISGVFENNELKGSLNIPMMPEPLTFIGTRG